MLKPLVSIITVCYNSEATIRRTLESIKLSTYDNIQYVVIDGGSTDQTLSIINEYEGLIDVLVSEKDNGIGDAWNKGLSYAKGELVGFLNSDDLYAQDTIAKAVDSFIDEPSAIIYGNCYFIDDHEVVGVNRKSFNQDKMHLGFGFVHTTCFVPKSVYEKVGGFDTSYRIAIDTDFLIRCVKHDVKFLKAEHKVFMELGGVSDSFAKKAFSEFTEALLKHKIINIKQYKKQTFLYGLYFPLRKLVKSKCVIQSLRMFKHKLVSLCNVFYNYTPTFYLRKKLLALFGFKIGRKSYILKNVKAYSSGNFSLGDNSIINRDCLLDNRGKISIGSNVSVAHNVKIYTGGHVVESPFFEYFEKDVTIKNNVCIFSNVIIQPGVTIEKGAVVLPGSVVCKNIEANSVYGGNPAQKVSDRVTPQYYKFNYPFWDAM